MDVHNPGPARFSVKPLRKATTPNIARQAADHGRIALLSDTECKNTIRSIALEIYQLEEQTPIWHHHVSTNIHFTNAPLQ